MISRVRGTEDILDLALHNFIYEKAAQHFQLSNFNEIRTPILEHTSLFVHSLGQATDVVSKEMYVFDPESTDSVCLRPEATASTIRACFENHIERFPWKVFTQGSMFRRERPQKGRLRQFTQMSIEVIGSTSIAQDAQFIKMLDHLFADLFMLENYVLKLNFLGCTNDRKKHKEALVAFLETIKDKICQNCLARKDANTLRVFDCKNETCIELYKNAPKITDYLCATCNEEWQRLQSLLTLASTNFIIDHKLVRGLDYYNKTVFEFSSKELGAQNAFCGGGRYSLGKQIGAKEDYNCIGAAIGIERLVMLLELIKDKLPLPQQRALHVILPLSDAQDPLALLLCSELQHKGLSTEIIFDKASMTNLMKKANKMGAKYTLIIGENEQKNGTVAIKNMISGESTILKQNEAAQFFK